MDKNIADLRIKDLIINCKNGCDNCPRNLVKVCKETGYMLVMLANADEEVLKSKITVKEK